ncbi:interleukin-27 receptor subunit alpha isoform X2 [Dromiciops gliroides]|uniref:interleukin-27 receptor subunit alpha isoform X2 n=1 Tax=Dromiciops gliroides TaxID=33562 RepID=UPI001CC7903C|nr:interleukin-27 receptor subunit alpha isoform X2 [Dromiciops gliroides]
MDTLRFHWTPGTSFTLFPRQPLPPKLLLMLWLLLTLPVRSLDVPEGWHNDQGSLPSAQLQCYYVGPKGDMNCTWGPSLDPGISYNFYYQSLKYHPNRTQNVSVPRGQGWVTVQREHLTHSDQYLVWLSQNDTSQPGDSEPLSLNLDYIVKPEPPKLPHKVEFSEDPTVVSVKLAAPAWPPHEKFKCQLRFRDASASVWQQVEPRDLLTSPSLELPGLELATVYEVSSRCQLQSKVGFWSDWSTTLKFQSLSVAPTGHVDVWVFRSPCSSQEGDYKLLWKDLIPESGFSYKVVFQVSGKGLHPKVFPCCSADIPKGAEWASVAVFNSTGQEHTSNLSLACSGTAPKGVQVKSMGNQGMLVTWVPEPQEFVVEWIPYKEEKSFNNLNWTCLPNGSNRTLLRGNFEKGVLYRVTMSSVSLAGLAFASPVYGYSQEIAPPEGPALRQIPNAASGALTVAWDELPREKRGGHFTHYTLYVQRDSGSPTLLNVSADSLNVTLWDLPGGYYKMWVIASTIAGPGQPGQMLRLFLPEKNLERWKVLLIVLLLCGILLLSCCLGLAFSKRCLQLCHKLLPHWVSERIPDPSNSKSIQPWGEELPQAPPPKDALFLEVEEVETPMSPAPQPPEAPTPLDSGYEKHFLPTPEELGLLTLPRPQTST